MKRAYLNKFIAGYISCAVWSSTDANGQPLDDRFTAADLTSKAQRSCTADCRKFVTEQWEALQQAQALSPAMDAERCGHNFWLTRNRHGSGFWDEGLGNTGKTLTDAAHAYGEAHLFVNKNKLGIYS